MNRKTKIIGAGIAAASLLALGAHAIAQGGHGGGHGNGHGRMGHGGDMMGQGGMGGGQGGMMGGGRGRMGGQQGDPAQRLEAAKTEIGIKAEQSAAWDDYAKVVTAFAAERRAHSEKIDRDAVHKMTPSERDSFRDSMRKQRDDGFAKVKAAAEGLVAQLDAPQKEKAQRVLPGLASGERGGGMRHGIGGHGNGHGKGHGMGHGRN